MRKWLLAALVPGGIVALAVVELAKRWQSRRDNYVSDDWLRAHGQRESRIDFVSVSWNWPVNKEAA